MLFGNIEDDMRSRGDRSQMHDGRTEESRLPDGGLEKRPEYRGEVRIVRFGHGACRMGVGHLADTIDVLDDDPTDDLIE